MAATSQGILKGFNGILDMRLAYEWNRDQILCFLKHVVTNAYLYGIEHQDVPHMREIFSHIERLCAPNGIDFASPGLEPPQSILRVLNPRWDPSAPKIASKFLVRTFVHNETPYWSLFDMLGLFISEIGPAPSGATTQNFFLPLLAVYARWCRVLGGAEPPTMYNSTWVASGPGKGKFGLGASIKGYRCIVNPLMWATEVRKARFNLINDDDMAGKGYTMTDSPQYRLYGIKIPFGNCAEVYPLLNVLKGNTNSAAVHGIALRSRGVIPAAYEDNLSGAVWKNAPEFVPKIRLKPPIPNEVFDKRVKVPFVPDNRCYGSGDAVDQGWKEITRGGDSIWLRNPSDYGLAKGISDPFYEDNTDERFYLLSNLHQLHCLHVVRLRFRQYESQLSKPVNESETTGADWKEHTDHCFEYLRLSITCGDFLVLEPASPRETPPELTAGGLGWGVVHECIDFDALRKWQAEKRHEFKVSLH